MDSHDPSLDDYLQSSGHTDIASDAFASYLDAQPVSQSHLRELFSYPTRASLSTATLPKPITSTTATASEEAAIYFCGNSLGLMPLEARALVAAELDVWAGRGVLGHFDHPHERPWKDIADLAEVTQGTAALVGAAPEQVTVMGTLTSNLHSLLCAFYKPNGKRRKILFENKAFPSDQYAFASQAKLHNLDPEDALLPLKARDGAFCLSTADILDTITSHGDEIALVLFAGVQYYTGQLFDIRAITAAGHAAGAVVGWDLAHAVGNVPLSLDAWQVDFACWCHYKYVNAGPGAIGGLFVHAEARYPGNDTTASNDATVNRNTRGLAGWWGHNPSTRFDMDPAFDPTPGAAGFQLSNPSVLNVVTLLASLRVFAKTDMTALRRKSILLTGYLARLLQASPAFECTDKDNPSFRIITPSDPAARGAQLSVLFTPKGVMPFVMKQLLEAGIVADERKPDVIRLSPMPLYNTFLEVLAVARALDKALSAYAQDQDIEMEGTHVMEQTT